MFDWLDREFGLYYVPEGDEAVGGGGAQEDAGTGAVFDKEAESAEETASEEGGEAAKGTETQEEEQVDPRDAAIQEMKDQIAQLTQLLQPKEEPTEEAKKAAEDDLDKPLTRRQLQEMRAQEQAEQQTLNEAAAIYQSALGLQAEIPQLFTNEVIRGSDGKDYPKLSPELIKRLDEVDNNPALLTEIVARHFFGKGVAKPAPKTRQPGAKIDAGAGTGQKPAKVEDMTTEEILAAPEGSLGGKKR